jgi:hypothetical protein
VIAPERPRGRPATSRRQRGVALIITVLILVLGVSWMLVSALSSWLNPAATNSAHNGEVLGLAKSALLGYVEADAMNDKNPGSLPCPEPAAYVGTANAGIAAGNCTLPAVGRLPWRTLGLDELFDASGQPLWYVVSPAWALPNSTATLTINFSTQGQLTVDGQANAAVALIIAPGPALDIQASANCTARNQTRTTTPPDYRDYLDCQNASGTGSFATSGPTGSFDDQVVEITAADVMRVLATPIARRIQRDIVPLLASAGLAMPGGTAGAPLFPYAAPWTNPTTSNYAGTAGTYNGLLPLERSRKACDPSTDPSCDPVLQSEPCVPATDAQCDPTIAPSWHNYNAPGSQGSFNSNYTQVTYNWSNATDVFTVSPDDPTGGRVKYGSVNCSASTSTNLICTIAYGCSSWCGTIYPHLSTGLVAERVGTIFAQLNPSVLPSYYFAAGVDNSNITLNSSGTATVWIEWKPPATPSDCSTRTCASFTINVASTYITDNVGFQSQLRTGATTAWFLNNGWQQWTQYAAAAGAAPPVAGALAPSPSLCSAGGSPACLTVNNYTPSPTNNKQALLVFSGRPLPGHAQPSSNLADYFEGANNTQPTSNVFEMHSPLTGTFNDRVLVIYP